MNSSVAVTVRGEHRPRTGPADASADAILEVVPRTMRLIRREMRSHTTPRLTVPQLRTLLYVRRHPDTNLAAVAEHLGISRPAGSLLVDRLVRSGHLRRTADPNERRRIQLRLTPEGDRTVGRVQARARAWLREQLAQLSGDELAALQRGLVLLGRIGGDRGTSGETG